MNWTFVISMSIGNLFSVFFYSIIKDYIQDKRNE
jgi:hypothetical protein